MNIRKLYYEDSHLQNFEAVVTGCEPEGNGWSVTLSATAFYPEGGGQACDTGILGEANVLSVREEGEQISHLCDKPLKPGTTVTGTIDWVRRFDLMQQHSGEHMVSGVIHQKYGYHNVGFHMGSDVVTIDFDGPIAPEDKVLKTPSTLPFGRICLCGVGTRQKKNCPLYPTAGKRICPGRCGSWRSPASTYALAAVPRSSAPGKWVW